MPSTNGPAAKGARNCESSRANGRRAPGLTPNNVKISDAGGLWSSNNQQVTNDEPILAYPGSAAYRQVEAALDDFRQLFPAALCYTKIVPVDEVVTLTLYYREDDHLARLMLDRPKRPSSTGCGTNCTTSARMP